MGERKNEVIELIDRCFDEILKDNLVINPHRFYTQLVIIQNSHSISWSAGIDSMYNPVITWSDDDRWFKDIHRRYNEYPAIRNHPDIGEFISGDHRDHLRAIIAHEMAHAINMWNWVQLKIPGVPAPASHGVKWEKLYQELRVSWVNYKRSN